MQRLFLRVRDRGIALHPMTQILEEAPTNQTINESIGMSDPIQFILRTGYLKSTPNRFRFVGRSTGLCGDEKPTIIGMTMPN